MRNCNRFYILPFVFLFASLAATAASAADDSCRTDNRAYGVIEVGGKGVKATVAKIMAAPADSETSCNLHVLKDMAPINSDPVVAANMKKTVAAIGAQRDAIKAWGAQNATPLAHIFVVLSSGMNDLAISSRLSLWVMETDLVLRDSRRVCAIALASRKSRMG